VKQMEVLFVQIDYLNSQGAKSLGYIGHFGLAEGLRAAGAKVTVVLMHQWNIVAQLLSQRVYDVVVVNDVIHGMSSPSVGLNPTKLAQLRSHCTLMVGVFLESLYGYRSLDGTTPDFVRSRLLNVEPAVTSFDTLWLVDENDLEKLSSFSVEPLIFNPFLPSRWGLAPAKDIEKSKGYIFIGGINEHRAKFISEMDDSNLIIGKLKSEDALYWDRYCALAMRGAETIEDHFLLIKTLEEIRLSASQSYLDAISNFRGLVHIPTYWKGMHPRFIEAVFAGLVPIMPYYKGLERCGLEANIHYLPFSEKDPDTLTVALRFADRNLNYLKEMNENARALVEERYTDSAFCCRAIDILRASLANR
jgi:hypothetical protein